MSTIAKNKPTVWWWATPVGYHVLVARTDGEVLEWYEAGNNPRSSYPEDSLPPGPGALSQDQLRQYAQETALEMALDWGTDMIVEDVDAGAQGVVEDAE